MFKEGALPNVQTIFTHTYRMKGIPRSMITFGNSFKIISCRFLLVFFEMFSFKNESCGNLEFRKLDDVILLK